MAISFPAGARVVVSGMVGGLVFWASLRVTGVKPMGLLWFAGLPASVLFGAVAAYLGVYLLANSDTSDATKLKHTLAFALVCGIVWSSVIDTAKNTVLGVVKAKSGDSASQSAQQLNKLSQSGGTAGVEQQIAKTGADTADAVKNLQSVANSDVKQKVLADSQTAVNALVTAAPKAPDASVDALYSIGKEAVQSGDPLVTRSVLEGLDRVEAASPNAAGKIAAARRDIVSGVAAK